VGRRLIVDTCVIVDVERGRLALDDFVADDDELAIAMVTAAELWDGVMRADATHRRRRVQFFERTIEQFPIEDYSLNVALRHGALLAHTRVTGRQRGAHDLMIAATAAQTERILVTRDGKAAFDGLPGVRVEFPKQAE
jgi:tRNA(fMet)-specific endonuclease VapC